MMPISTPSSVQKYGSAEGDLRFITGQRGRLPFALKQEFQFQSAPLQECFKVPVLKGSIYLHNANVMLDSVAKKQRDLSDTENLC